MVNVATVQQRKKNDRATRQSKQQSWIRGAALVLPAARLVEI
jgi:hypothetical protein